MGGNVFTTEWLDQKALKTPRMPPDIYCHMRDRCVEILKSFFDNVATPLEAPGKESYGDIDLIVHSPKVDSITLPTQLIRAFDAVQMRGAAPLLHFALPWPKSRDEKKESGSDDFIQLDVHIVSTLEQYSWEVFHLAHGDMWNILGTMIRPCGITVNDKGMYVRHPDIEKHNKKQSMILLTNDPVKVLKFLGLNTTRWAHSFNTQQELFEYAASCRFFHPGSESKYENLKHNDKARYQKRPMFRAWVDDFLPRCRVLGLYSHHIYTRDEATKLAVSEFGVQGEYNQRHTEWLIERTTIETRRLIKDFEPIKGLDPAHRGSALAAIRKITLEGDTTFNIHFTRPMKIPTGYDVEAVRNFLESEWLDVARKAWERDKIRGQVVGLPS